MYVLAAGYPLTTPSGLPLRYGFPQATRFLTDQNVATNEEGST